MSTKRIVPFLFAMLGAVGLSGCDDVSSTSESLIGGCMLYEIHCKAYDEMDNYLTTRATPFRFLLPAAPEIPEEFGFRDLYISGMCDCASEGRIGYDEMVAHSASADCRYFSMWEGPRLSLPKVGGVIDYPIVRFDKEIELPTDRSEEGLPKWSGVRFISDNLEEFKEAVKPMLLKQIEDTIAMLEESN